MKNDFYIEIHRIFNSLKRLSFPYSKSEISKNGLYIFFEKGEQINNFDRIVHVGTHVGNDRLQIRLNDLFYSKKQRNSIFRKHLGRCLLNKEKNEYLEYWNLPFKKRTDKEKYKDKVYLEYEKIYEDQISDYIQENLSFCIIPNIVYKNDRDRYKEGIISILSQSPLKTSSLDWIGNFHPDPRIVNSKIWNIKYLNGRPLTKEEFEELISH